MKDSDAFHQSVVTNFEQNKTQQNNGAEKPNSTISTQTKTTPVFTAVQTPVFHEKKEMSIKHMQSHRLL